MKLKQTRLGPQPSGTPRSAKARWAFGALAATGLVLTVATPAHAVTCAREVTANVVAIDQSLVWNRLGASNVNGQMFALRRDVVPQNPAAGGIDALITTTVTDPETGATTIIQKRNAKLREDKRPRPLVLRVAAGDCLTVNFQNLLSPTANPNNIDPLGVPATNVRINEQVAERTAAFHAAGMQLRAEGGILNDGSHVGANASSQALPGQSRTYKLYAEKEGVFIVTDGSTFVGSDANQGSSSNGLFGQVIVEPKGAKTYRSQVTEEDLRLATRTLTSKGQPVVNYEARYPNRDPWTREGKAGLPVLNMICPSTGITLGNGQNRVTVCTANEIVHSEIDAVIAGPNANGTFPASTYPLEANAKRNPAYWNRLEPFRDFASVWHDEVSTEQAYPGFYSANFGAGTAAGVDPLTPVFAYMLKGVRDKFMINYGSGGIGTEILSNRFGVGPMHDCLSCAYEEFFLTTFTVGDVGQVVDIPANAGLEGVTPTRALQLVANLMACPAGADPVTCDPAAAALGPKATKALYPVEPSNIHRSYTGDFVKFRNTHIGFEQHVFHLHNHQWLFNPNDDNSNYLDAQGIGPGMGYSYEITNGGSGNRNKSSGDAIFHCHFYPHFAQGMWYMWRISDVYETGTKLAKSNGSDGFHTSPFSLQDGTPATGARAQPDGEIAVGTPIPAVVPLPGKAMAPMPAAVTVKAMDRNGDGKPDSSQAVINYADMLGADGKAGTADDKNPGYPFWVAGIACGQNDPDCVEGIVGQRPPTPPLDMISKAEAAALKASDPFFAHIDPNQVDGWDGGLPRHALHGVLMGGKAGPTPAGVVSPVDLTKLVDVARPQYYPEAGTPAERVAMYFHSIRNQPSFVSPLSNTAAVTAANFVLNGRPPMPGGPFADPCVDDAGNGIGGGNNVWFGGATATQTLSVPAGIFTSANPRIYKGANMQYDAVLNKVGYHYPQQRIVALWEDVLPTINKQRPGEPLVMRLNTFDCAMYHHTNLVPATYELDDYQVRTPTDIIGQHIHLPKWDLSTTDGAANGWNYEDGTLSYGAVQERIHAINHFNELVVENQAAQAAGLALPHPAVGLQQVATLDGHVHLAAKKHPFFPEFDPSGTVDWKGARTTMQRWFADPLFNTLGHDRGLGIIFTHDHYGPSSFQQVGLYSTVLIEPAGSAWKHAESGKQLGYDPKTGTPGKDLLTNVTRIDGGPTSFQAAIITTPAAGANRTSADIDGDGKADDFREFYFEYTDFQHAYEAGIYVGAGPQGQPSQLGARDALGVPAQLTFPTSSETFRFSIAPPHILPVAPIFPDLTVEAAGDRARGVVGPTKCPTRPCPTAIDFLEPGHFVVNYRNEPVALRVYDPNKIGPDGKKGAQADGLAGDLAFAMSSSVQRAISELNRMPNVTHFGLNGTGAPGDPYRLAANPDAVAVLGAGNLFETVFPPHINDNGGVEANDPFTPMLRTYSGDRIRIKAQAGGDEEEHSISVHGMKWLQAGSGHGRAPNSGWKNAQSAGISEQFSFASPVFMDFAQQSNTADYLYTMDATQDGWWSGMWGVMRNYNRLRNDLFALPNNPRPVQPVNRFQFQAGDRAVCPNTAALKTFDITAVLANDVLPANANAQILPDVNRLFANVGQPVPAGATLANLSVGALPDANGGTLVFNPRTSAVTGNVNGVSFNEAGPLHDPTAAMYVRTGDLVNPANPKAGLKPGVPVEPLVLRANAGDCIQVTVRNALPAVMPDLPNFNDIRHVVKRERLHPQGATTFSNNLIRPSSHVGFRTQLVEYDVTKSDGFNVGLNPIQTAAPGDGVLAGTQPKVYTYYAGDLRLLEPAILTALDPFVNLDAIIATPVEFGGANMLPADPIKQGQKGLYGQMVIMPRNATVVEDAAGRTSATVTAVVDGVTQTYRDHALVWQKMLNYRYASGAPVQNLSGEGPGLPENPPHTNIGAANYKADPLWFRLGLPAHAPFGNAGCVLEGNEGVAPLCFGQFAQAGLYSNAFIGGADPSVPIFTSAAGQPTRIHLTQPQSSNRGSTIAVHGHVWARDPFLAELVDAKGFPVKVAGRPVGGVGSVRFGTNPMSFYQGAQDNVIAGAHWDFVLPSAGGVDKVIGDYLLRDTSAANQAAGAWSILRVQ